jgi:tripeptide aminopeptidase
MDVVEPWSGKKSVLEKDGTIHSAGDTVLGADDISGILEILYGVQLVIDSGKPHKKIELLFTIGEELYVKGSDVFDYSKVTAKQAYVLDLSGAVGTAARRAPSIISVRAEIRGKAAHAGFEPENGIHAIFAAANAVSRLCMGHVDEETTFNIGTIQGGTATNIVPDCCVLTAYETPLESKSVTDFQKACEILGFSGGLTGTFGGSDNNSFAKNGIEGLVLSNGMYNAHSTREYTTVDDLYKGAELIGQLILL